VRSFIYWLMGDRAGRVIVGSWRWLWGLPVESGGKVAVAVAEESLQSMQESVQQLAKAVAQQVGAYERARTKYRDKIDELRAYEQQARLAQRAGQMDGARLAMSRAIQIEKLLPALDQQVQQAGTFVEASKDKLNRERIKLDLSEVNAALESIAKVNNEFDIGSARSSFEAAKSAVEGRNLSNAALAELSDNPQEKLAADLDQLSLDDQVSQRLKALESTPLLPLPEAHQP
jgi:phage shock protein A